MADLIKDPEQVRKLRAEGKRGAVQINEYGKPDEKTVGDVRVISGSELLSASSATVISALRNIDPILLAEESSKKIPLIIIDDKEVPLEELIELDENKVQSITLLKDAAATERYGKRAKNGVIVVKTQKEETIATTRINYLSEMRVVKAKNEGAITTAAKSNDLDYTKVNVTYKHGKYYNPDGVEVPERNVFGVMDYNGRFLSNKDLKIANGFKHSSKSSRLHSIEANEKETRVTFICEIYWDHNWLFVDRDACLIDPKTGDNYMIRDIEGVQEVGRMYIVSGLKGRFVEQTMIFPPLQKGVEKIDYYEPANYIDIPDSDTNGGGLTIKNININDYSPKKKGRVIR